MYQPRLIQALHEAPNMPADEASLLLSAEAYPLADLDHYRRNLDEIANPMRRAVDMGGRPEDLARLLSLYLHDQAGFRGNRTDYDDPRNSFITQVLDRKKGIPISLSALWMGIGRRLGISVEGISFPRHFIVRVGGDEGVYADPFYGGRILQRHDLQQMLDDTTDEGIRLQESMLRPVSTLAMVIRMLMNLKAAYEARADYSGVLLTCDRLVDLTGLPEHQRDRGVAAYHLGSFQSAWHDLEAYLDSRAEADDAWTVAVAAEQAKARASSNLQ